MTTYDKIHMSLNNLYSKQSFSKCKTQLSLSKHNIVYFACLYSGLSKYKGLAFINIFVWVMYREEETHTIEIQLSCTHLNTYMPKHPRTHAPTHNLARIQTPIYVGRKVYPHTGALINTHAHAHVKEQAQAHAYTHTH